MYICETITTVKSVEYIQSYSFNQLSKPGNEIISPNTQEGQ